MLIILVFILEFPQGKCNIPVVVDAVNLFNYFSHITGFEEVTESQYSHEKESINWDIFAELLLAFFSWHQ